MTCGKPRKRGLLGLGGDRWLLGPRGVLSIPLRFRSERFKIYPRGVRVSSVCFDLTEA